MNETFNVYCDESCHLQSDGHEIMALGSVWCPESKKTEIFERIREIKIKHNLRPHHNKNKHFHTPEFEIKWNKVSNTKLEFYKELIDFFFDDDDLHFRVLIVPNKKNLELEKYNLTHDGFYYRMYFDMLKVILNPEYGHNIYIDIKDTKSTQTVNKLTEVLRTSHYDFSNQVVRKIQQVRSHEVELIQLADLLVGAVSYVHRNLSGSKAKVELIEKIKHRSKYSLTKSTLVKERKFNIFIWKSSYVNSSN